MNPTCPILALGALFMTELAAADTPLKTPYDPAAAAEAVVVLDQARFTVLTPTLIRMEWSADGQFEDRASHAFVNRRLAVPRFEAASEGGWAVITTEAMTLRYREGGGRFSPDNLTIEFKVGAAQTRWTPGTENKGNLHGTYRTLDGVSGTTDLEPGILSRDGWTLVDDAQRLLFDNGNWPWATPRPAKDAIDWYFFAYGRDYPRALRDFIAVAGRIPLPPRYAFGAWWSRYWAYSDAELRTLVEEFQAHGVPLDVLVVDMDWHLDGWTGYTWNPEHFPDPEGFLSWTKEQGLKVPLNLHPADGVGRHERAFPEMAAALGLDPDANDRIPFDCTDRRFVEAYFKYLHHPLERQGVDFWWLDWQQGQKTKIAGLDPLFWLNYLQWTAWERDPGVKPERPLIFSRWGGLGNHRYQIGFSGDTFCNWPSLAFQPQFTSTAGNVGYAYWSHDIGGHQPGPVDPELYVRWIQWGALSPILRTHTTKNPEAERRIWAFDEETYRAAKDAWLLRYSLIPYIYSAARTAYDTGLPLCRPLYYEWPEHEDAYANTHEYLFGPDLLVAPVTAPRDGKSRCTAWKVWLPPGGWTHWYTGRSYRGPGTIRLLVPLEEIPLFVRDGAIIQAARPGRNSEACGDPLVLHIFGGDRGETVVYEDDGLSRGYERDGFARTPVRFAFFAGDDRAASLLTPGWARQSGAACRVTIGAAQGRYRDMPRERAYEVHLHNIPRPLWVQLGDAPLGESPSDTAPGWAYDDRRLELVIRTLKTPIDRELSLSIQPAKYGDRWDLVQRGIGGAADLLAAIGVSQGDGAPAAGEIRKLLAEFASSEAWSVLQTRDVQKRALRLAADVAGLPDGAPRRDEFLARLLGLSAVLELRPGRDGGTLDAVVEVSMDPPLGITERIPAKVLLTPPANWRCGQTTQEAPKTSGTQQVVALRTPLTPDAVPQSCELRARVVARVAERDIELPVRRRLLPGINGWWVVGPFDAPRPHGLATVFPPEGAIDLAAVYEGKDKSPAAWRKVVRPLTAEADLASEFFVNFRDVFGKRHHDAVAYALVYLHAPRDMDVILALGSDDGFALWLNGEELRRTAVSRAFLSKQDRVPLHLNEGSNALLLKIDQHGGDWGVAAHIETAEGEPVTEVRVALEP